MKESFFENINIQESTLPERTAQQISRLIVERRLTSEDRLPSEFELAELLHVGRGTIREGVKLLVARNVLEIRRGKGTYIASNPGEIPDPLGFAYCPDPFQLALDLAEVRGQLEPWIARMAAEHAAKEDLNRLRESCLVVEQDILTRPSSKTTRRGLFSRSEISREVRSMEEASPRVDTLTVVEQSLGMAAL